MDTNRIVQDLNRRFSAPLPEFYKRRIIFWHDPEREFIDKLYDIHLDQAKLVSLTETNNFAVKKTLSYDDQHSNYVVYCPIAHEALADNWILDIELYSEEFRADLISIWIEEMGIPSNPSMRKQVRQYRKFFNAKARRVKIQQQKKNIETSAHLQLAIMAGICGIDEAHPNAILRSIFRAGLDIKENSIYQDFVNYDVSKAFWEMAAQGSGYSEVDSDLGRLAIHMLLTASTRTLGEEYLAGLDSFISIPHQSYCYDFISEWLQSSDIDLLYEVSRFVEAEVRLPQRFDSLTVEDLADTECFPCINELILLKHMAKIEDQIIDIDLIRKTVERRRTLAWYKKVESYYEGIWEVANIEEFYRTHRNGFHTTDPKEVWKEYTEEYYKMDRYYRQFHLAFQKSLESAHLKLDDHFKLVAEKVERLYTHWFLGELGNNWSDACSDQLANHGQIIGVPQQTKFYSDRVEFQTNKVYVIISDALRYEVGASLAEQLQRETQSKVSLKSMQSIFPSITKFGMAALLPHDKLSLEIKSSSKTERIVILADGVSTESNYREKVLQSRNLKSVALQYKGIIGLRRNERQELVKGKDVVYIYHDSIDEASHNADTAVFPACDKAISEIKNLIKIIVNEFSGANIIVTADHGFLYTYHPLREADKISLADFKGTELEYGRRYAILNKNASPEYLLPVKFFGDKTEYRGFTPRESIRIKMSGSAQNYVHGGISLQELVVPVIEYRHLRNTSMEYLKNREKYDMRPVTLDLVSTKNKISNMIFSLKFYQKEAVGMNREQASYELYFTDSNGQMISDVQKIIADRTSSDSSERSFRVNFNLKPTKYSNTETYYLVITDESGLQMPKRFEFQIDIPFAIDEFNFFI